MSSTPCCLPPPPEPFATSVTFLCPPLPFFAQIYQIWIWWLCRLFLAAESFATTVTFLRPPFPLIAQMYGTIFDRWVILSLLLCHPPPCCPSNLPKVTRFCAHPFLSSFRFAILDGYVKINMTQWRIFYGENFSPKCGAVARRGGGKI